MLVIVFGFDKFRSNLTSNKAIVYTDHPAIHYLMSKKDAKPKLIRWVLFLQEFNFEMKEKKGPNFLLLINVYDPE